MSAKSVSVSTPASLSELADRYRVTGLADIELRWRFARAFLKFCEANPKMPQKKVMEACLKAAGEDAGKSEAFASRYRKAAEQFPMPPTEEQAPAFRNILNGNTARANKSQAAKTGTAKDALAGAIGFAKLALNRGMETDQILAGIRAALEGEEAAQEAAALAAKGATSAEAAALAAYSYCV